MSEIEGELFTLFPVFLLVDVSVSMTGGPIEALNAALPDLKKEMATNHMVGEIARISLITFADQWEEVLPLCDLATVDIPLIEVQGGTNFAEAFRGARAVIERAMGGLPKGTPVYRPVVFFMSDGEHQAREEWQSALDQLRDRGWKFAPEVVAFGFGDARAETLQRIATRFAFLCKDNDPIAQVREIMSALLKSIRTTSSSLQDPTQQQGLHLEAPAEHFTPLPPLQI
jgi:uncharacterized protein YegL